MEKKIEVTHEMMEAGVIQFAQSRGLLIDTPESAVWSIFKAMVSASPQFRTYRMVDLSED